MAVVSPELVDGIYVLKDTRIGYKKRIYTAHGTSVDDLLDRNLVKFSDLGPDKTMGWYVVKFF